jgi:methylglyoxal synthase
MKPRIALIAHDKKKDDMITLAAEYIDFLRGCVPDGHRHHRRAPGQ